MSINDQKVRELQVEEIASAEVPVSGEAFTLVKNPLRYDQAYTLDDDYDLVYKSFITNSSGVSNPTTVELTAAELSDEYGLAEPGFEVICTNITDNPLIYKKGITGWYSIPLGTIS